MTEVIMYGILDMERYCNRCMWYNSIQRVEKDGKYIINCELKECSHGKDKLSSNINALFRF